MSLFVEKKSVLVEIVFRGIEVASGVPCFTPFPKDKGGIRRCGSLRFPVFTDLAM